MKKNRTKTDKLFYVQGSIYDYKGNFDCVIVFIGPGLTALHADYIGEYKKKFENDPDIVAIVDDCGNGPNCSASIEKKVRVALDTATRYGCKNIGFHGVSTCSTTDDITVNITLQVIQSWLRDNSDKIDSLTLVDKRNGYAKFFND